MLDCNKLVFKITSSFENNAFLIVCDSVTGKFFFLCQCLSFSSGFVKKSLLPEGLNLTLVFSKSLPSLRVVIFRYVHMVL